MSDAQHRGRQRALDVGLAFVLALLAVLELAFWWTPEAGIEAGPWSFPLALAMTLPLVARRAQPDRVMGIVGISAIVTAVLGTAMPTGASFGILVALYTVAALGPQRDAVLSGIITLGVLLYVAFRFWDVVGIAGAASNYLIFGTAWTLGWAARHRRLLLEELQARAERAERSRADEARRAVRRERARIARELHDVVAHAVSVVVVQAGAARRQLTRDPAAAEQAIAAVEATGRNALDELRRLLAVLRPDEQAPGPTLAPQPSLLALETLVASVRDAGLPAQLTVEGALDDVPAGIDVSAYRVVQEALTNVLKHAGAVSAVQVHITRTDDAVALEITDDGRGAASNGRGDGRAGHGIIGMRERLSVYGGELHTGPRPGGGFTVRARFPIRSGLPAVAPTTPS